MGAGSTVFAKNVLGDCMCSPALRTSELSLYDIDGKRLAESELLLSALNHNINEDRARITTHLGVEHRKEALRGAEMCIRDRSYAVRLFLSLYKQRYLWLRRSAA